jgi:hypothetical protein
MLSLFALDVRSSEFAKALIARSGAVTELSSQNIESTK